MTDDLQQHIPEETEQPAPDSAPNGDSASPDQPAAPPNSTASPTEDAPEFAAAADASDGELIPEWLERIRARRATDLLARRKVSVEPPAPRSLPGREPPPATAADAPLPHWLRDVVEADQDAEDAAEEEEEMTPAILRVTAVRAARAAADQRDVPDWLHEALAEEAQAAQADAEGAAPSPEDAAEPGAGNPSLRARRAARRKRRAQASKASASVSAIRSLLVVFAAAFLIATIFTFWTPADFLSSEVRQGLSLASRAEGQAAETPSPVPTWVGFRRVGVVSGHRGQHPSSGLDDPGAVCEDGFTEAEVNFNVAQRVVTGLSQYGYNVVLLDEWDPRLAGFEASALISIHADSCFEFELEGATGFKVAPPAARQTVRPDDARLVSCLVEHYATVTGMAQHPSITRDMTEYHNFREISPLTPGAIIEVGFLFADRDMLENHPDLLAQGIVEGLLCFLEDTPPTPLPQLTPWPTAAATPTPLAVLPPS